MANKVRFGLKNLYYAIATIANDGTATYAAPVALPGAVSITLDPEGDVTNFYADDIAYFVTGGNSGYTGSVEVALIPDGFRKAILGDMEDGKGVLFEDADAETVHFALLFEFTGDESAAKHVLYNCTASRTSLAGQTKEDTKEVQTESFDITANAIYNSTLEINTVKSKVQNKESAAYTGWYEAVYTGTA